MAVLKAEHNASVKQAVPPTPIKQNDNRPQPHHVRTCLVKVSGLVNAIQAVYKIGGPLGYFRGMSARVIYQMPSTAICWSTYEFFKYMLTTPVAVDSIGETPEAESPPKSRGPAPVSESWPRELPAMSGAGMYGTLSFTTVHTTERSLDITHS
ncbi:hypothetical protein J6590_059398 [Homalodisca vitripennis]|nr:hypothetical protein J6590_059398 [Homalodisca vitripennis]